MNSVEKAFTLLDSDGKAVGEIVIEFNEDGSFGDLHVSGHDLSNNGVVLDMIMKLLGPVEVTRLWMSAQIDFDAMKARAYKNDAMTLAKEKRIEQQLCDQAEREGM